MQKGLLILLLLFPFYMQGQIITTVAGTGAGYCCDGGPATAAGIRDPVDGAFDNYGNYYIVEAQAGNRIRKIDASGTISTIAGTGTAGYNGDNIPATTAQIYEPVAVKLDASGNVYIDDLGNFRIRRIDVASGLITTIAGTGINGFGGDNGPATAAMLGGIEDMCLDKWGNIYLADDFNHRVRKIDTFGTITTIAGTGTAGHAGDNGPATAAKIRSTLGLAVDGTGNVYITDSACIRKISISGIITTVAGNYVGTYIGDGMPATAAQIAPEKLTFDELGQLYIADAYNLRVYKIDNLGIMHTVAGNGGTGFLTGNGGPATAASIYHPLGLAFDSCGNLYIAESTNQLIRKVALNPNCWPESVSNRTQQEINIYPNPVNNELHIDRSRPLQGRGDVAYVLRNMTGVVVRQGSLKQGNNSISVQSLSEGMYMMEVVDEEGRRMVKKIVKE